MKKTLYTALALLLVFTSFCSCKATKVKIDEDEKDSEKTFEDTKIEDTQTNEGEYVKPATFSKAYTVISDRRAEFYDILSASLKNAKEETQIFIDIHHALAGESTFVYVSNLGSVPDDMISASLRDGGFSNVKITQNTSESYTVTGSTNADGRTVDFKFDVSYSNEKDSFTILYSDGSGKSEKIMSVRRDDGFFVQYCGEKGIRFILRDDGTGKMIFCKEKLFYNSVPETEEEFSDVEYDAFYEIDGVKFHSIYNGVEYTYPEINGKEAED